MRRLDSAFWTSWHKWLTYLFLAFMWGLTIHGFVTGNQKVIPMYYILPPCTVVILWWLSGFKQVTLDGDALIIRDSKREARVLMSQVKQIDRHPLGKGLEYITIVFKSETEFGRRVRIMTGTTDEDFDRIVKRLRNAMDGKNVGVKINHASPGSVRDQNSTNGKEVIVSGWTSEELSAILTDFADLYGDRDLTPERRT